MAVTKFSRFVSSWWSAVNKIIFSLVFFLVFGFQSNENGLSRRNSALGCKNWQQLNFRSFSWLRFLVGNTNKNGKKIENPTKNQGKESRCGAAALRAIRFFSGLLLSPFRTSSSFLPVFTCVANINFQIKSTRFVSFGAQCNAFKILRKDC